MIDRLHIELSTFCNAKCPACPRTIWTKKNVYFKKQNIDFWTDIKKFDQSIFKSLKTIQICGNLGDPILHPEFLEIVAWMIENSTAEIEISTNGEPHNFDWWQKLATVLKSRGYVIFGIDGLADTHQVYRAGTDFQKIIDNASNFIQAGGRAWWQYIPFKHNEHQIIKAKILSQKLHFERFFLKDERPQYIPELEPWSQSRVSIQNTDTNNNLTNICLLFKGTVYMSARGTFYPCCYLGEQTQWEKNNFDTEVLDNYKTKLIDSWKSEDTIDVTCKDWCQKRKLKG